jgi:hypothetical protein
VAAAKDLWPSIQSAAQNVAGLSPILTVAGAAFGFLAQHIDTIVKYAPLLIAAFVAYKAAQTASMLVEIAHLPITALLAASNFAHAAAINALLAAMGFERTSRLASIAAWITSAALATYNAAVIAALTVASWALSAVTGAMTAAQWLLNVAMSANPIALVIIAIVALVAGLVLLYRNSETARDIINAVWATIQGAIGAAWTFIRDQVFAPIVRFLQTVIPGAFDLMVSLVTGYIGIFRTVLGGAWSFIRDNVFEPMRHFVGTTLPAIFSGGVDAIGRTWDGLVDKLKTPIRIAFNFVNDKVIGPVNSILGKFPGSLSIPSLPGLASGGLLRGPGTGTSDSILGVDPTSGVPTAAVSNGEWVMREAAVKKYGVGFMQSVNLGHLATGGLAGRFGVNGYFPGGSVIGGIGGALGDAARAGAGAATSIGSALTPDFLGDLIAKGARKAAEMVLGPMRSAVHGLLPADQVPLNILRGGFDKMFDAVLGKGDEQDNLVATAPDGGGVGVPGMGSEQIKAFIRSVDPLPYVWGATGPRAYDCSGLAGTVMAMATGRPTGRRYFTTSSFGNGAQFGFKPGLGGTLDLGFTPGIGHVVGSYGGLGFEARSTASGIFTGSGAKSPSRMARHFHLASGGLVDALARVQELGRTVDLGGDPGATTVAGRLLRPSDAALYDGGGVMYSGQVGTNRSGRPERVLSPSQTDAFERLVQVLERGGVAPAAGGDRPAVIHLTDSNGVLLGTIDGRIDSAYADAAAMAGRGPR